MTREAKTEQLGPDPDAPGGGLAAGDEFAGHRIESEIGRGGMGVVYRARHLALDLERALKVIAPTLSGDERFRVRFRREARAAAAIEHPNVIPVGGAGEEGDRLYLSMRLVHGPDLGDLVGREGPLEPGRAAAIVRAVAAALDAAHERGLVHRDVKPSNVLLERRGDTDRVFITDFGISRLPEGESAATSTAEFIGSPDYVAPEQIEGEEPDRRADIYSLAGLTHFMLTGEPPFPRRSGAAKLVAQAAAERPRPSAVAPRLPRDVDSVVARGMAVRSKDRFGTAGQLAGALERAVGGTARRRAPRWGTGRLSRRLSPAAVAAIALSAVAATAAGLAVAGSVEDASTPEPTGPSGSETEVGEAPVAIAIGESMVWAASHGEPTVWGIDPASDGVDPRVVSLGAGRPRSVAVGFRSVWVADPVADELVRLRTGDRGPPRVRIQVGGRPSDVALDERWVWVTNQDDGTVSRVDPVDETEDRVVEVGDGPRSIATGAGAVWVANTGDGSVSRIESDQAATVGRPIGVGRSPNDLAVGAGSVWVVDSLGDRLRRIDAETSTARGNPIEVGTEPRGVAFGLGEVWVANSEDDTVSRVDASSGEVAGDPIAVGDDPADVAVGFESVWTANFRDDTVTRIEP